MSGPNILFSHPERPSFRSGQASGGEASEAPGSSTPPPGHKWKDPTCDRGDGIPPDVDGTGTCGSRLSSLGRRADGRSVEDSGSVGTSNRLLRLRLPQHSPGGRLGTGAAGHRAFSSDLFGQRSGGWRGHALATPLYRTRLALVPRDRMDRRSPAQGVSLSGLARVVFDSSNGLRVLSHFGRMRGPRDRLRVGPRRRHPVTRPQRRGSVTSGVGGTLAGEESCDVRIVSRSVRIR